MSSIFFAADLAWIEPSLYIWTQPKSEFFSMNFKILRHKKRNLQPSVEAAFPTACAIGAFIGLHER
jgi:hypothetical protein